MLKLVHTVVQQLAFYISSKQIKEVIFNATEDSNSTSGAWLWKKGDQ
jgi:hypothetical protein